MKIRISILIPESLAEKIKNHTYWTPGMSMNRICEEALHNYLKDSDTALKTRDGIIKRGRRPNNARE